GAASVAAPAHSAAPTTPVTFRMHGSNTIGSDLAPALAEAFLQRRTAARSIVRERTAPDEVRVEARDGTRPVEAIEIFAHGTATGFTDLAQGECDIGLASRRIHADEATRLASLGDLTSAASEHVIGLDGIAVIVNPANAVSSLTKSQIGDVFAGKIARWSQLGGADRPIVVHARDDRSGTYDTFRQLVLAGRSLVEGAHRHESSEELSDAVAADASAVGFIGLPYVRSTKAVMVQEAESAPLLPSPMTVSTEDYPLARRLYMYLPPGAPIAARDFVDFALSEDGQKVVQATGFVDLRPSCDANAARCTSCDREYREAVRGACRLSMDFRFDHGQSQLDTRALRDLQRVVGMMQTPAFAGRSLLLFGFSDGLSSKAETLVLSQQRASIVAAQLKARGLHVDIERGIGPQMLVADDTTEEGLERNRRVEVWLR
ncbi:MAG TPA: phosphate ABC transporter substrate-binding/OmpA family protein, partial [Polyangiaceae bacterium]|nr:phosphate ABC transporter substrate-binding/OmpA family protein [Polyangiaceae bacterium]